MSLYTFCALCRLFSLYKKVVLNSLMDFCREVAEAFFDFHHELNKSNDIVEFLYRLMCDEEKSAPVIFDSFTKRIRREAAKCRNEESFGRLVESSFENLSISFDPKVKLYKLALMFHMAEVLFDQCLLAFEPISTTDVKELMIVKMAKKLYNQFGFRNKSSWYRVMAEYDKRKQPAIDYMGILGLFTLFYVIVK